MNKKHPSPSSLERFLSWLLKEELLEEILGDLHEYHDEELHDLPKWKRKLLYWFHVFNFLRPFALKRIALLHLNFNGMYRNHFKMAWRSAIKNGSYTAINLLGLATGIACFGIIALYVHYELSYDKFHKDADRIYRVAVDQKQTDGSYTANTMTVSALIPSMVQEIPEVVAGTRFRRLWGKAKLEIGEEAFFNDQILYTDSAFFSVFSFPFIHGDPQKALSRPGSIVLTRSMAIKLFGTDKVLGKVIDYTHGHPANSLVANGKPLKVTGVIKDVPPQSHFSFDILVPIRTVLDFKTQWKMLVLYAYFKTTPNVAVPDLENKIQELVDANMPKNEGKFLVQQMTGMSGIHLASNRIRELDVNGNSFYVKALLLVAFFVIIIAGVNYINLSTARSSLRAKEIGVRKVIGAQRKTLVTQFLTESIMISVFSGVIAIGLIQVALPFLNTQLEKELSFFNHFSQPVWYLMAATTLTVGLVAGLYPALFLSSFRPAIAMKSKLVPQGKRYGLRHVLVVFQFGLAVLLTVGVMVVQKQMQFIQSADLGFDKDLVIQIKNGKGDGKYVLRNAIRETQGVIDVSSCRKQMGLMDYYDMEPVQLIGSDVIQPILWRSYVDEHYFEVFDIQVIAGRNFVPELDKTNRPVSNSCILNEKAVKSFGLSSEEILGRKLSMANYPQRGEDYTVVGVIKDFHPGSLHQEVKPLSFVYSHRADGELAVKLAGGDVSETISRIEEVWSNRFPNDAPMEFYFLDEAIDRQYRSEQSFRTIFSIMTGLSIVIACLGIFGLAAFMAEKRMKEIGIRKVLGASTRNLLGLMTKEYVYLILVANLIAWPIAYFAMSTWLESFAYRISVRPDSFIISGILVLIIAITVVSALVYKTAIANPVDSLRDE